MLPEAMFRTFYEAKRSSIATLFLILGTFVNGTTTHADIDHTKLKGLSQLIRPEYQYLSPVHGFTLLKKGILENLYRYGNADEQTVRLIQTLFHAVDTVNFCTTRLPSNVSTYLN